MPSSSALQRVETDAAPAPAAPPSNALISFDREQLDVLKATVAAGTSDAEFALFVEVCKSTGLNPFQKQIYAIVRETWNPKTRQKEPKMTIQTGIDGYRLTAARTGQHAGTDDAVFGPEDDDGHPAWAQVTVYRFLPNGYNASFTATARWDEYRQAKRSGELTGMWSSMPYGQLAKCAESLALRKAFPAELSGVYTREEMAQADVEDADVVDERPKPYREQRGEGLERRARVGRGSTRPRGDGRIGFEGEGFYAGPDEHDRERAAEINAKPEKPEPKPAPLLDEAEAPVASASQTEILTEIYAALEAVEEARQTGDPAEICMEPVDLLVSSTRGWPDSALDYARRCGRAVCRGDEPRAAMAAVAAEIKADASA